LIPPPNERELDALREVANIGAGHAATALSKLVGGRKVGVEVPRATLVERKQLPILIGREAPQVAAVLRILGELQGQLALVLPQPAAHALCGMLLNMPCSGIAAAERDAFSEAANILASACLSAVGQLTGFKVLPSTPELILESADALARRLHGEGGDVALVIETRFFAPPVDGQLFLVPSIESVRPLLERLGV
jgi:chemotaxis protein CheC